MVVQFRLYFGMYSVDIPLGQEDKAIHTNRILNRQGSGKIRI